MRDSFFSLDSFRLEKKTAVVTGAFGNLGPWWCRSLLSSGARVVCLDLAGASVPETLSGIFRSFPSSIFSFSADITDPRSLAGVHRLISDRIGTVDLLVNNAGIDVRPRKLKQKEDWSRQLDRFRTMWDVNVQGVVTCIETFSPDMKKNRTGAIVTIGSLYATRSPYEGLYDHLGFDKPWAYGATKSAVLQVTRHFATRLAPWGVRVNTLSIGGVLGKQDVSFQKKYASRVPLGRMAEKERDLGGPLVFLLSDAARYVTGINLEVDGGYTAW